MDKQANNVCAYEFYAMHKSQALSSFSAILISTEPQLLPGMGFGNDHFLIVMQKVGE
ncbi:MAG: hypothetical protein AB7I12_10210 [Steroidobacteraceae bacterium]